MMILGWILLCHIARYSPAYDPPYQMFASQASCEAAYADRPAECRCDPVSLTDMPLDNPR
jgi:hypothetical protein